jgi:glutathione synthase/RimK-type ligase-like ATP-grasp enzyme
MKIYLLTDYKDYFGSRYDSIPYRSGFDKNKITKYFAIHGIECEFKRFCHLPPVDELRGCCVLYTSSEDKGNFYKSFIEDIILHLERNGIKIIPGFDFLKAHNNKVYMELLRNKLGHFWNDTLKSRVFGTLEELEQEMDAIEFPVVVKKFDGAMSRGVFLANSKSDLIEKVRSISRAKFPKEDLKDLIRPRKHKGYLKESIYRKKYVVQQFIPDLANDWKVLVYGERLFILTRHNRKNDFRASGSHCNYLAGSKSKLPEGILDFALRVRDGLHVPHVSLDIIFDGHKFHAVEFQAIYFGTSTVNMSDVFFEKVDSRWKQFENKLSIEQLYADGIFWFLNK